jgi:hypothetical protein
MEYEHAFKAFTPETLRAVTWLPANDGLPFPVRHSREIVDLDITWIRRIRGHVVIMIRERPIQKLYSFDERFFFLDVLDNGRAHDVALQAAHDLNLSPLGDAEVAVRLWLEDIPTFGGTPAAKSDDRPLEMPRFYALSNLQHPVIPWHEDIDLARARDFDCLGKLRHSLTKIWSSRWGAGERDATRSAFRLRANEDTRTAGDPAYLDDLIDI